MPKTPEEIAAEAAAAAIAEAEAAEAEKNKKPNDKPADDKPSHEDADAAAAAAALAEVAAVAEAARDEELRVMRENLARFEGIDPAKAKAALEAIKDAENNRRQAEKDEAARNGEVDRLKTMMAEDNQRVVDEVSGERDNARSELAAARKQIEDMTVGAQFSGSKFITEQLVLTPSKTRTLYGSHFAFEDGTVIAYDKPAGVDGATKLVDRQGKPLAFDAALEKIVSLDPEFDSLKRSSLKPGASSKTEDKTVDTPGEMSSLSKIRKGLEGLGK